METLTRGFELSRPEDAAWIAGGHYVRRNVLRHHRACTDNTASADLDPGHHESARTDKRLLANGDLRRQQLQRGVGKIMAARAEIRLLGDGGAGANLDFA